MIDIGYISVIVATIAAIIVVIAGLRGFPNKIVLVILSWLKDYLNIFKKNRSKEFEKLIPEEFKIREGRMKSNWNVEIRQKIKFAKRKEIIKLNSQEKVKHKDHSRIKPLYEKALELEKRGEYKSSIETYEKIIDINEYYKKAWEGLERIYEKTGESEKRDLTLQKVRMITEIIDFETNAAQKINLLQFELQNLDFFDNLFWTFQPQINILLGRNGYGKTYLLRLLI